MRHHERSHCLFARVITTEFTEFNSLSETQKQQGFRLSSYLAQGSCIYWVGQKGKQFQSAVVASIELTVDTLLSTSNSFDFICYLFVFIYWIFFHIYNAKAPTSWPK